MASVVGLIIATALGPLTNQMLPSGPAVIGSPVSAAGAGTGNSVMLEIPDSRHRSSRPSSRNRARVGVRSGGRRVGARAATLMRPAVLPESMNQSRVREAWEHSHSLLRIVEDIELRSWSAGRVRSPSAWTGRGLSFSKAVHREQGGRPRLLEPRCRLGSSRAGLDGEARDRDLHHGDAVPPSRRLNWVRLQRRRRRYHTRPPSNPIPSRVNELGSGTAAVVMSLKSAQ